jgi:hypothetical protein
MAGYGCISGAAAATPENAMSAHLWITGLPDQQMVVVTLEGHAQICYFGSEGRYDFPLDGQQGETIRVLADGKEVQTLVYEPGANLYISLAYADGTLTAVPYEQGMPLPAHYTKPTIAPEPQAEHTSIGLSGPWIFVMAIMLSLIVVGCFATIRRKA